MGSMDSTKWCYAKKYSSSSLEQRERIQIMRKKILIAVGVVFVSLSTIATTLVFTSRDKTRNYASTISPVAKKRLTKSQCKVINRQGLDELRAYGSGFINYGDFGPHMEHDYKNLYMISLMHDPIFYYKGRCLRWYGLGYTPSTLGDKNKERKYRGLTKALVRLVYGTPPTDDPSKLQTEEQIMKELGIPFYEPLLNHRNWLSDLSYIDNLIKIFEQIPVGARVYFHCIHGRGRTTTYMVFYDIFRNGKKLSLETIVNRHHCLGRENLLDTTVWKNGSWSAEALQARKDLVTRFYDYMTHPEGYPSCTWAQWSQRKGYQTTDIQIHVKKNAS